MVYYSMPAVVSWDIFVLGTDVKLEPVQLSLVIYLTIAHLVFRKAKQLSVTI